MLLQLLNSLQLLTIFLIPLLPAQFGFGYEQIKVLAFLALTVISGLIFTYLSSLQLLKIRWTQIKIAALVFLVILTLTTVLGIHPLESLTGQSPYFQGLILYWLLFLFFLIVSEVRIKWPVVVRILTFTSLIISAIAIGQFILLDILKIAIPNYAGRVVSTFGQPNLYSGFLLLSLPLIFEDKRQNYLVIPVMVAAIILSFSKAAITLLLITGLWFLIGKFRQKGPAIYLLIFFFINVVVFSMANSSGIIWDEVVKPLSLGKNDIGTVEKRAHILPVMIGFFTQSPLFGSGIDSISFLYQKKSAAFAPETVVYSPVDFNLKNLNIDRSHSYFLDLLIFSGILGLLSYLYLIYLLFKTPGPKSLKIFLILYLIWTQFQVQSIAHLMLFWFIAGIIDNMNSLKDDKF